SSSATSTDSPVAAVVAGPQTKFCKVDRPDSWRDMLTRGKITLPDSGPFLPVAVAADGTRAFGGLYSDDWSGVVSMTPLGSVTRIKAFGDPHVDQVAGAAFDGRWLVWAESHSSANAGNG